MSDAARSTALILADRGEIAAACTTAPAPDFICVLSVIAPETFSGTDLDGTVDEADKFWRKAIGDTVAVHGAPVLPVHIPPPLVGSVVLADAE